MRSVPVRGETSTVEAPAALMNTVVDNEELQDAMTSLHISELTEIQVRLHLRSHSVGLSGDVAS